MATSSSTNDMAIGSDEMLISLKATAHLRFQDPHSDIVVARAGTIDTSGKAIKNHERGQDVLVFMQKGTSQSCDISRAKARASRVCLMPPDMSYADAASMVYPFVTGLTILQTQLGIEFPSPSIGLARTVGSVPTALILGGERALADALTQLLHLALPGTSILVACRVEDTSHPEPFEEAVRPFCHRALENGAVYSIDAAAPDLLEHLQAAVDTYGASLQLVLDAGEEVTRWPGIMGMLDGGGKFVDCTRVHVDAGTHEDNCLSKVMATLEKLLDEGKLRPPICNDMYTTTL
ncbi:hypothetical protein M409DRAFT_24330 [Zasmidium cellare ATCC 36951]|uniref:Uncharacterized protein n=1 Tax=Zasmidium cellare ATCC 36951 TaxID=1080233 RepID=A0A6A6CIF2_ZASCE|nr:uncharacterized protein M409DRAFT_24330 [Zasmidium cellare ATCC 36951]KAF2165479.1 hypothetical protein M409DRAFT_24330 [Zasmidium cellare ATCC 36951]